MAEVEKPESGGNGNNKIMELTTQVNTFIIIFITLLIASLFFLSSKFFRSYLSLKRIEIYMSHELKQMSIYDLTHPKGVDFNTLYLRDFYIASAYRPYVCYYHKYDYVSLEIFKKILQAGPRMVELEIFNSNYGDDVEPIVSIGEEKGEWTYTLNTIHLNKFLKIIAGAVFNSDNKVGNDPFILYLNLKTNKNVKCLNKIHKYLYNELGGYLLSSHYSYNAKNRNDIVNITMGNCRGKILIFAKGDFENTNLEELINYSTNSNYTMKYLNKQRRILYVNQRDIVDTEEDIEDYVNAEHHKLAIKDLNEYNKYSFTILSPETGTDSLFDGISPINHPPSRGLESGSQFIMMNYQKIDTNMSNYMYIFKDSSFILKKDYKNSDVPDITYKLEKDKDVKYNQSELNYHYVISK